MENCFEFPEIPTEQLPKVDNGADLKKLPIEDLPNHSVRWGIHRRAVDSRGL